VALSKGLACPVGSVLAGNQAHISRAVTARRRFGGAMRQSGILAAAGLYALDHNVDRLADDHANAKTIAAVISGLPCVNLDLATVQTNIVIWQMAPGGPDAAAVVAKAKAAGVLISALGAHTLRAVTHIDVSAEQCRRAAEILADVIGRG
jgi:threonine aldolase